jgi:hypothetical protein
MNSFQLIYIENSLIDSTSDGVTVFRKFSA